MLDLDLAAKLRNALHWSEDRLAEGAAADHEGRAPEPYSTSPEAEWCDQARAALADRRCTDDEARELLDAHGPFAHGWFVEPAPGARTRKRTRAGKRTRDPEDKAKRLGAALAGDGALIGASDARLAEASDNKRGSIPRLIARMVELPEDNAHGLLARAHVEARRQRDERAAVPRRAGPDRRAAGTRARSRDGADRESLGGRSRGRP